ncbi:MAG: YicC family protein [Marinibacterium sp.]|nr:YicC family protein [Marinibacterium sp.]
MIHSMTAFASARGASGPWNWAWELRSVNARGLDLRLRVPDWLEGLEAGLRADLGKALNRGSVTLSLKLTRLDDSGQVQINARVLSDVLAAMAQVEDAAMEQGVTLAPSNASDVLQLRGVLDTGPTDVDPAPLVKELRALLQTLLTDFLSMRASEGAALAEILGTQIDTIETLTTQAAALAEDRSAAMEDTLRANLTRVMENVADTDPDRVAQELALIAVKADVTEEIDRLRAHVTAARELMQSAGPVGRKLDFLMQEFNREANTLCSKSQNRDLTNVGLELKAVIDQMREQVQNVE